MNETIQLNVSRDGIFSHLRDQFDNSSVFLRELLQNSRRAGATEIDITTNDDGRLLVIADDGDGIASPEDLFTLGQSGFAQSGAEIAAESPFGMGFAACLFAADFLRVETRRFSCEFAPEDALAFKPIDCGPGGYEGTRVSLWLPEERVELLRRRVSESINATLSEIIQSMLENEVAGFPVQLTLDGVPFDACDRLDSGGFEKHGDIFLRIDFERCRGKGYDRYDDHDMVVYAQGLSLTGVRGTKRHPSPRNIIHLDNSVRLRVPDRVDVVDEHAGRLKTSIDEAVAASWVSFLAEQAESLSAERFVTDWFSWAIRFCPAILNDKPLPNTLLERYYEPLRNERHDYDCPSSPVKAGGCFSRDDQFFLLSNRFYGDLQDEDALKSVWVTALAAEHDVPVLDLPKGLDEEHWIYKVTPTDEIIQLATNPDAEAPSFTFDVWCLNWHKARVVDEILFSVGGRMWSLAEYPVFVTEEVALVPKQGGFDFENLLLQSSSYNNEYEEYDETALDQDNQMFACSFQVALGDETGVERMLQNATSILPSSLFANKTITLTFGETGRLEKVA